MKAKRTWYNPINPECDYVLFCADYKTMCENCKSNPNNYNRQTLVPKEKIKQSQPNALDTIKNLFSKNKSIYKKDDWNNF